jgi:CTP synthase (UTP-ammonia lyase)
MIKYIFISGSILESKYMKAIFIASIGALLKEYNLKINIKKITYHKLARTFVTYSGHELDLDLGFYERITGMFTNLNNNLILNGKNNKKDKIIDFIENDSINYDIILVDLLDYNNIIYFNKKNYLHIHLNSYSGNSFNINPHFSFDKKDYKHFINPNIYKIPYLLNEYLIMKTNILELLNIHSKNNLIKWSNIYNNLIDIIYIHIIIRFTDSYISLEESLKHACYSLNKKLKIIWVDPITLTKDQMINILNEKKGGIIVPGGFGENGFNNKIEAIKFARENNIPFLGICYGMQIMVIEFAKNVCNIINASTQEIDYNNKSTHIIHLNNEFKKARLGNYNGKIKNNTIANKIFNSYTYNERYRHKYNVNNKYIDLFEKNGLFFTGKSLDENIMEIAEVPLNNFFIGVQFHPELNSSIFNPHPVLISFIKIINQLF